MKSWFTYESSLLGSQLACMATYGLYTLIIYIFNNNCQIDEKGNKIQKIKSEWQFFEKFFEFFGTFDWDKYMITIFGPIKHQNVYEKLRDECNFDLNQLAMNERL